MARDNKAVVVTTPTALKAFMLKFIELLHVLDKLATDPKSLPKTSTTTSSPETFKKLKLIFVFVFWIYSIIVVF